MEHYDRRTWAEIDLRNLKHNYHALRSLLEPGCKLLCPVKADAYGHGALSVARRLEELGADYLAGACVEEGVELRQGGVKAPILILGHTDPAWAGELMEYALTQTVDDEVTAQALSRAAVTAGRTITVHLKVDTGMSRIGLLCNEDSLGETAEAAARMCALHPPGYGAPRHCSLRPLSRPLL